MMWQKHVQDINQTKNLDYEHTKGSLAFPNRWAMECLLWVFLRKIFNCTCFVPHCNQVRRVIFFFFFLRWPNHFIHVLWQITISRLCCYSFTSDGLPMSQNSLNADDIDFLCYTWLLHGLLKEVMVNVTKMSSLHFANHVIHRQGIHCTIYVITAF